MGTNLVVNRLRVVGSIDIVLFEGKVRINGEATASFASVVVMSLIWGTQPTVETSYSVEYDFG